MSERASLPMGGPMHRAPVPLRLGPSSAGGGFLGFETVPQTECVLVDTSGTNTLGVTLADPRKVRAGRRVLVLDVGANAGTKNITVSTVAGTITGDTSINADSGWLEYQSDGTNWFVCNSGLQGGAMTIGSPVSGAAANGLLYVDGSGNLGQDAYVNLSASVLTIGGSGAFGGLVIVDTSGNDVFRFETGIAKFGTPNGSTMIGDPFGVGFNSVFEVDDANQKTTCNVKHQTTGDITIDDSAKGLLLKSPNGHYWRGTISNAGAVTWTDTGTSPP